MLPFRTACRRVDSHLLSLFWLFCLLVCSSFSRLWCLNCRAYELCLFCCLFAAFFASASWTLEREAESACRGRRGLHVSPSCAIYYCHGGRGDSLEVARFPFLSRYISVHCWMLTSWEEHSIAKGVGVLEYIPIGSPRFTCKCFGC